MGNELAIMLLIQGINIVRARSAKVELHGFCSLSLFLKGIIGHDGHGLTVFLHAAERIDIPGILIRAAFVCAIVEISVELEGIINFTYFLIDFKNKINY